MLYDPKWGKTKSEPTLLEFVDWLETKDPNQEYQFTNPRDCLYAQFLRSRGEENVILGGCDIPSRFDEIVHPLYGAGVFRSSWRSMMGQSYERTRGWTFGDALRRARAAR